MFRIAYVNGRYVSYDQAVVSIEDRGYQFADGIYEVIALINGRLLDAGPHLDRLERSLRELEIPMPVSRAALRHVMAEVIRRSRRRFGGLYIQITRGEAPRDHGFPKAARPSLVVYLLKSKLPTEAERTHGVGVVTVEDIRWQRRDIKSVSLLPNALAKQEAVRHKAKEAILVGADGVISEASSSNFFIVRQDGSVVTHPATTAILGGVTRDRLLQIAASAQISVREEAFRAADLADAAEAFLTSTSIGVLPVVTVDGKPLAGGTPGPVTRRLAELYLAHMEQQVGPLP